MTLHFRYVIRTKYMLRNNKPYKNGKSHRRCKMNSAQNRRSNFVLQCEIELKKKLPNISRFYVLISFSSNENFVLFVIYLRFVDIVKRWHTVNCMYHIVYHFFGVEK